jgi:hypothetical protein
VDDRRIVSAIVLVIKRTALARGAASFTAGGVTTLKSKHRARAASGEE